MPYYFIKEDGSVVNTGDQQVRNGSFVPLTEDQFLFAKLNKGASLDEVRSMKLSEPTLQEKQQRAVIAGANYLASLGWTEFWLQKESARRAANKLNAAQIEAFDDNLDVVDQMQLAALNDPDNFDPTAYTLTSYETFLGLTP